MENENKNYIEEFAVKLRSKKSAAFAFISGIAAVLFAITYIAVGVLSTPMFFYTLCILLSSVSTIIYSADTDKKIKYTNDILVIGMLTGLLGIIVRVVQLGIHFSIRYFVGYIFFAFTFIMLIIKHTKNIVNEKKISVLLTIATVYTLFEALQIAVYNIGWASYRISEALLFISYILILSLNKSEFEEFPEKTGKYKYQIPSLKTSVLILIIISVLSVSVGAILEFSKGNKTVSTTTTTTTTTTDTVEKAPENKAKGTVNKTTTTITDAEPEEEIKELTLNQIASSEKYDFTLNKVEFLHRVEPDNPPNWYTYYDAPENEVYLYVNATVKNKQKQSVKCDEVYSVTADYNNGYTYKGFNIADDTDGDFTYANITSIEPLQSLGVHCLIACPQEVETSESPLFLTITLKDGSKFKYTVR